MSGGLITEKNPKHTYVKNKKGFILSNPHDTPLSNIPAVNITYAAHI